MLRRRLGAAPDDAQCHYLLGQALMDDAGPGAEAAAEAQTREALRLYPRQPLAEAQLARILLRRGQAAEATAFLQDALASEPYNITALNMLTRSARQAGDLTLADATSMRSKQVFADQQRLRVLEAQEHQNLLNSGVHQQLAQLYARTGQPARATQEQEMVRLLKADPQKVLRDQQFLRTSLHQILPDAGQ